MRHAWARVAVVLSALSVALVGGGLAGATTAPGTPAQVKALVAKAPSITTIPSDVAPPLADASTDNPANKYPFLVPCLDGSVDEPACASADLHGTHTMVLFGDSHALMWYPALLAIAQKAKWRLVALMDLGCPVADVTVWNVATNSPDTGCPTWRAAMIKRINALRPSLVVISEGFYTLNADDAPITSTQWSDGLATSLEALHAKKMKKVVLGQSFLVTNPVACLDAAESSSTSVQSCSRPWKTATFEAELAADRDATTAARVPYVNEVPWECSTVCTAIIGRMIVYNSTGHLTVTYDDYLTDVLRLALKPSMG